MKNCLFRILTLSVIASLLFSGCTAVTATKSNSSRNTSIISSSGGKVSNNSSAEQIPKTQNKKAYIENNVS